MIPAIVAATGVAQDAQADVEPGGLHAGHVYLAPSGRRCRLCPSDSERPFQVFATLLYDRLDGRPARGIFADGFVLSRQNWHLLRRVA